MASVAQIKNRMNEGHKKALLAMSRGESPYAYLKTHPERGFEAAQKGTRKCVRTLRGWDAWSGEFALTDLGKQLLEFCK